MLRTNGLVGMLDLPWSRESDDGKAHLPDGGTYFGSSFQLSKRLPFLGALPNYRHDHSRDAQLFIQIPHPDLLHLSQCCCSTRIRTEFAIEIRDHSDQGRRGEASRENLDEKTGSCLLH